MRPFVLVLAFVAACGEVPVDAQAVDAGLALDAATSRDAQVEDASLTDAAVASDAAGRDAAEMDAGGIDAGGIDAGEADASPQDAGASDAGPSVLPDPVLFIHGINGSSADFDVMRARFEADGWPSDRLFALDFMDPRWGCNVDNAAAIEAEVTRIQQLTGAARIDLVAHSMGTLSSRHYVKHLGGTLHVNTYVTLGGLHHGNRLSCLNPLDVCVWKELCPTQPFLSALNAEPATPGDLAWVSIYSTDDETVPTSSSELDGAENIELMGPTHAGPTGLLEVEAAYLEVRRVLEYPAW